MKATGRFIALSGAMLFGVLGCSPGSGFDGLPDPAGAVPTGTISEATGTPIEYSPEELVAALSVVDEKESLAGVIVDDAAIRKLIESSGTEAPGDLSVSPPECDVFAETDLSRQALSANLAVMTFAGASSMHPDSLSLTSQGSDEMIEDQLEANRTQLTECSEFEMETASAVVTASVTELTAATDADKTFAVNTVVQVPGTIQETVSLTALVGTTTINVSVGSSGDPSADLARGEKLVNATVAALTGL